MLKRNFLPFAILWCIIYFFSACNNSGKKDHSKDYPSPPGYDLSAGKVLKMPQELDEISGVYYYAKDSSVFAIDDEKGFLYKVFLDPEKDLQKWRFSKHGDFEDLVLVDSTFYILQSKGTLFKCKFISGDTMDLDTAHLGINGSNEFEILYYDKAKQKLIAICKDCEDDKKSQVTAYAIDPSDNKVSTAFQLDAKDLETQLDEKGRFKPSAAGINPVTNELFIVSSVNKALVICDVNGGIKSVFKLDPKVFKQPEGLTFTSAGDLIISNEAADKGAANILFYQYKQTSK